MCLAARQATHGFSTLLTAAAWTGLSAAQGSPQAQQDRIAAVRRTRVRKIATEEAFTIPAMIEPVREVLRREGRASTSRCLA